MDMGAWMAQYLEAMKAQFGERLRFVGLQGSRARGEAGPQSDIDVVAILDRLTPEDLCQYGKQLDALPQRHLICGFLSGWTELMNWDAGELFYFYHDTRPYYGSLEPLRSRLSVASVKAAICRDVGGIYHGCVHNLLHERDEHLLRGLYKGAVFALRGLHYCRTGQVLSSRSQLMAALPESDRSIVQNALMIEQSADVDFEKMSDMLFLWAQGIICAEAQEV